MNKDELGETLSQRLGVLGSALMKAHCSVCLCPSRPDLFVQVLAVRG